MAQTLEYNKAVTAVTPVDIPSFDDDLDFIQKLDDEPNDVGGLSAAQLKAEFDKSGNAAKEYINNELIPAILAEELTEEARALAEAERVANEQERVSNEEARIKAEQERVNETSGVVAQAKAQAEAAAKSAEQAKSAALGQILDGSIEEKKLSTGVQKKLNHESREDNPHGVTAAQVGAATSVTYTATVTTAWTSSGSYFYQDVSVNGIQETDAPIVDVLPGSDNAANVNYSDAICKVFRITTSANSIRVWAVSKPAVAFPIQIKVVR